MAPMMSNRALETTARVCHRRMLALDQLRPKPREFSIDVLGTADGGVTAADATRTLPLLSR